MAALVEGDDSPAVEELSEPVPVAGVRAQAVEEKYWGLEPNGGVRLPLDVVEADAISFQPAVDRFSHRRLA
jgi:hypothetical protein